MQHEGERALSRLLLEHAGNVGVGVARMDDERQAGLPRRGDMGAEALLLHVARAVVVVIVEPRLADRHHLGMARELDQLLHHDVGLLGGVVRMRADRAEHIVMRLDDGRAAR